MSSAESSVLVIKIFFTIASLMALAWFVLIPFWRYLRQTPTMEFFNPAEHLPDDLAEGDEELIVPAGGKPGTPDRLAIIEQARSDPHATANAVSRWLTQKN